MSKLFEVDGIVFNAERIESGAPLGNGMCRAFASGHEYRVDMARDAFVQLWRKALGEDVRTDEQRMRELEARAAMNYQYDTSGQREVGHVYNMACMCMNCARTRSLLGC